MRKRVREEDNVIVEEGEEGGRDTVVPNQFGQWLLENIYKYAEVRDSEELATLRKKLKRVNRERDALREFAWQVMQDTDFERYPNFCCECGNTRLNESRTVCGRCYNEYAPCKRCEPRSCASKRHLLCGDCEDEDVVCNGRYDSECDFEQ